MKLENILYDPRKSKHFEKSYEKSNCRIEFQFKPKDLLKIKFE